MFRKLLAFALLAFASSLAAQTIAPNQIRPGDANQCLVTVAGVSTWTTCPGGGGIPAGVNLEGQLNQTGAFGGNRIFYAQNGVTLQATINSACAGSPVYTVVIPAGYTGTDNFVNTCGASVQDYRTNVAPVARSVKEWGAVCDGVTNDATSIQNAFDAEFDTYGSDSIPKFELSFPNGTCYVATAIQYRGEAFHGSSQAQSKILSGPGQDIFAAPDNADGIPLRGCCFQKQHVHDITGILNASVDANIATAGWAAKRRGAGQTSIFANTFAAWSGQTVKGAVTNSATSIPLTTAVNLTNFKSGIAMTGWVENVRTGEFMQYQGITNTSCPNSAPSCLLNVTRGDGTYNGGPGAAAMVDGDSIVPLNILDPTNVTDWIPAWNIGSCMFAFPARDGLHGPGAPPFGHGFLDHVTVTTQGGAGYGESTCFMYLQSASNTIHVDHIYGIGPTYGIIAAPSFYNTDASITETCDGCLWSHLDLNVATPFVAWNGGINALSDSTLYAGGQPITYNGGTCPLCTKVAQEPHSLTLYRVSNHAGSAFSVINSWTFNNLYIEPNNAAGGMTPYGALGQIDGNGHSMVGGAVISSQQFNLAPIVVNAGHSTLGFAASGTAAIENFGNLNNFTGLSALIVHDNNNAYGTTYGQSGANQYGYKAYNPNPTRPFSANKVMPDFLQFGAISGDWFQSLDDLFMTPDDMQGVLSPQGTLITDSTVPITGKYLLVPSPGLYAGSAQGLDGQPPTLGQRAPFGKGTFYISLKASTSAATQAWATKCGAGGFTTGSSTFSLTTTWAIYSFPYDNTATSGCALGDSIGAQSTGNPSVTQSIQIGYYMWMPQSDYLQVGQLTAANITPAAITGPTTINNLTTGAANTITTYHDYNLNQNGQCWLQSTGGDLNKGLCVTRYGGLLNNLTGVPWVLDNTLVSLTFNNGFVTSNGGLGFSGALTEDAGYWGFANNRFLRWNNDTFMGAVSRGLWDFSGGGGVTPTKSGAIEGENILFSAITLTPVGTPGQATLAVVGTPGTTSVSYACVGKYIDGTLHTAVGATSTVLTTAPNSPNGSNYVNVTCVAPASRGVGLWDVYRITGYATQGKLASCSNVVGASNATCSDQGLVGDGTTAPVTSNMPAAFKGSTDFYADAVTDYGFVADWNGTTGTNNSPKLQAWLNSLPSTGGTLKIPCGQYYFHDTVSSNAPNITIEGCGVPSNISNTGATQIVTDQPIATWLFGQTASSTSNLQGPTLRHLQFVDGSASNNQMIAGIELANIANVTLDDVNACYNGVGGSYSAGNVSIAQGSTALTLASGTFPAAMQVAGIPAYIVLAGRPYEITAATNTTATLAIAYQEASLVTSTAYNAHWGGVGEWQNPALGYVQYVHHYNMKGRGCQVAVFAQSGTSSSRGTSAEEWYGGYYNGTGNTVPDTIGIYMGHYSDTFSIYGTSFNSLSFFQVIADGHQHMLQPRNEIAGSAWGSVPSCAAQIAASNVPQQSCLFGILVESDNSSDTYGNRLGGYMVRMGNAIDLGGQAANPPLNTELLSGGSTFRLNTNDFVPENSTSHEGMLSGVMYYRGSGGFSIGAAAAGAAILGTLRATTYSTTANCNSSASPAVCGSAAAGAFNVAAAATTVTVNTTAVTANSDIILTEDSSLGTRLGVTCNTTPATAPATITAKVAATSFSILTTAPTTNPRCFTYTVVN